MVSCIKHAVLFIGLTLLRQLVVILSMQSKIVYGDISVLATELRKVSDVSSQGMCWLVIHRSSPVQTSLLHVFCNLVFNISCC